VREAERVAARGLRAAGKAVRKLQDAAQEAAKAPQPEGGATEAAAAKAAAAAAAAQAEAEAEAVQLEGVQAEAVQLAAQLASARAAREWLLRRALASLYPGAPFEVPSSYSTTAPTLTAVSRRAVRCPNPTLTYPSP
jgi:hypothetical protein